jgi:hypothetical protein
MTVESRLRRSIKLALAHRPSKRLALQFLITMRETAEQRQERLHCVAGLAQQLHALEDLRSVERDEQKREEYETKMMTVLERIRRVRTEPRRRI